MTGFSISCSLATMPRDQKSVMHTHMIFHSSLHPFQVCPTPFFLFLQGALCDL